MSNDQLLHLYELPERYERVYGALSENGGELTEEIEAELNRLEDNLEQKAENISGLIRRNLALAMGTDAEIERLTKLSRTRKAIANRLKEYLLRNMREVGRSTIETARFTIRRQGNSMPSVEWKGGEPTAIPVLLRKQPPPPPAPELDAKRVTVIWRYWHYRAQYEAAQESGDESEIKRLEEKLHECQQKIPADCIVSTTDLMGSEPMQLPEDIEVTLGEHVRIM